MDETTRPSWWPTELQELLLKATLLSGEDARTAWAEWSGRADFDNLDDGSNRVIPAACSNLLELGIEHDLLGRMKGIKRRAWLGNQLLLRETATVIKELDSAGIESMMSGDAAVTIGCTNDIGKRPIHAVDIVVKPDATPKLSTGNPDVRIQRQVIPGCRLVDAFFEGSSSQTLSSGQKVRISGPADLLLQVFATGLRTVPSPAIQWVYDAFVILQKDAAFDWDRFVDLSRRLAFSWRSAECLGYLERFGVGVPAMVRERLKSDPSAGSQRLEFELRLGKREKSFATQVALHRVAFRRYASDREGPGKLALLPSFLKEAWGAPNVWSLPAAAIRKVWRRLRT